MQFPSIPFNSSPSYSIGVEWEFAFVDRQSRDLVNCAESIIPEIHRLHPELIPHVHKEFLSNTVEFVTGISQNARQAVAELRTYIEHSLPIMERQGVNLFGAGTHPFARWTTAVLTQNPRYEEMVNRTQWWGRQMLIWGVHVHIGIPDSTRIMHIISSLLTYYPALLALSASSPMWDSFSTGYASNRAMLFQQLPTAGLPFQFTQWKEFEEFVHDQLTVGIIENINEIRWDIRPVPRFGTVEVRVSDSCSNFQELTAIVALTHCLVVWLDSQLQAGIIPDRLKPWQVQENKWRAARYGLEAIIITHSDNTEKLLYDHLLETIEILMPTAEMLDCLSELQNIMQIYVTGASYQRQGHILEKNKGNIIPVVDAIVEELLET